MRTKIWSNDLRLYTIFRCSFFLKLLLSIVFAHMVNTANNITNYIVHTFMLITHISFNSCSVFFNACGICCKLLTTHYLYKWIQDHKRKKKQCSKNQICFRKHRFNNGKRSSKWLNQYFNPLDVVWITHSVLKFDEASKPRTWLLCFILFFFFFIERWNFFYFVDFFNSMAILLHIYTAWQMWEIEFWWKKKHKPVRISKNNFIFFLFHLFSACRKYRIG